MADAALIKAITRIATQYIPNTKGDVQLGWIARLNDYSGRLLRAAHPVEPPDEPPSPDVIPNHAMPLPEGFSYEDLNVVEAEYKAQYGETPQETANRALTAVLRPDPNAWANITDTAVRDDLREKDAYKAQAVKDYLDGEIPWFDIEGYLGLSRKVLGAIDISQIRDLGA